jgi:hypothetical protein
MSSINSVSSSSSNSAAVYQEMLARQLAAKAAANSNQAKTPSQTVSTPPPSGDVDHDGDSH